MWPYNVCLHIPLDYNCGDQGEHTTDPSDRETEIASPLHIGQYNLPLEGEGSSTNQIFFFGQNKIRLNKNMESITMKI